MEGQRWCQACVAQSVLSVLFWCLSDSEREVVFMLSHHGQIAVIRRTRRWRENTYSPQCTTLYTQTGAQAYLYHFHYVSKSEINTLTLTHELQILKTPANTKKNVCK